MTITNPRIGRFINWERALVGEPADSVSIGEPLVQTFNHLRRFRAQEYIASYYGRVDPNINGGNDSKFHIISRFPVRESGDDAEIVIQAKLWHRTYVGPPSELWRWYKNYTNGVPTYTLLSKAADTAGTDDLARDYPSGNEYEWGEGEESSNNKMTVTPEAIGIKDGFRCSRLEASNCVVHRLNIFGCPHSAVLSEAEALIGVSDVGVDRIIKGWDDGNDEGTLGVLAHHLDADDSVIHNTARALFNTPYAKGIYQTGQASFTPLRSDAAGNSQTYKVKPRNLTGGASDVPCDIAVVLYGSEGATIRYRSLVAGDSSTYTCPAAMTAPTLLTTSDFSVTLDVDPAGDEIKIDAYTSGADELHVQAVSLWEPYRQR